MLKDWNGLEEVMEVTAFWGEGIGRNPHTLELQELDGLGFEWISVYSHEIHVHSRLCHEF
jgi:hypothetical protein